MRGFRIELGEVEEALRRCADVAEAAATATTDADGHRRLAGYVVPAPGRRVEPGGRTPRTRPYAARLRGAVDRPRAGRLAAQPERQAGPRPAPDPGPAVRGTACRAPGTPPPSALAAIWAEVLRSLHRRDDNFRTRRRLHPEHPGGGACARQEGLPLTSRDVYRHQTDRRPRPLRGRRPGPPRGRPRTGRSHRHRTPNPPSSAGSSAPRPSTPATTRRRCPWRCPTTWTRRRWRTALNDLVAHHDALAVPPARRRRGPRGPLAHRGTGAPRPAGPPHRPGTRTPPTSAPSTRPGDRCCGPYSTAGAPAGPRPAPRRAPPGGRRRVPGGCCWRTWTAPAGPAAPVRTARRHCPPVPRRCAPGRRLDAHGGRRLRRRTARTGPGRSRRPHPRWRGRTPAPTPRSVRSPCA